jgi:protein TonB
MSIVAIVLGFFLALALHAGFILYGGAILPEAKEDFATLKEVELIAEDEAPEDKKEDDPEQKDAEAEELEAETDEAPDASEIIKSLELMPSAAPALDDASLAAIQAALSNQLGDGMTLSDAVDFSSSGRLSGKGKPGQLRDDLADAFSLTDIDQKPRATFQPEGRYPSEMRGKKIEGQVTVIFVVDSSGKVVDPRVEKSNHVAFEKPALDAVRQWKFEPGLKAGQRVSCRMKVPIRFREAS